VEHHEQQAQKEPQEDQHHGGESPQREAQTAPQKAYWGRTLEVRTAATRASSSIH
jgi:hypothetical protein